MTDSFALGKLPADLLSGLLASNPINDPRVIVGQRLAEPGHRRPEGVGQDQFINRLKHTDRGEKYHPSPAALKHVVQDRSHQTNSGEQDQVRGFSPLVPW